MAAAITPSTKSTVALNDRVDTVNGATKGTAYTLRVWVRTSAPGNVVMIKAREVGGGAHFTHSTKVRLSNSAWHQVVLAFKTRLAKSNLDINALFWSNKVGRKIYVDSVSLVGPPPVKSPVAPPPVAPTPSPSPTTTPSPSPTTSPTPSVPPKPTQPVTPAPSPSSPPTVPVPSPGACTRTVPKGTVFGTSISTSGVSAADALTATDAIVGKIPVVRVFDPNTPMAWDKPRTKAFAGRDLVMSFRPMPQDVLSGKYDAMLREWFQEAPTGVDIFWSYIHEPEPLIDQGRFTADQYRRAWKRIDAIADSVCRSNTYATLILTGWTTLSSSKRDWRAYYAGDDVIDVMAFDPYNGASNPEAVTGYPSAASIFDAVVQVAKEAGKPYAIAETGSPKVPSDATGAKRAAWLTEVADYHRKHGAVFVTYFNSSNDGEWRLLDKPSQTAWRAAVASSVK